MDPNIEHWPHLMAEKVRDNGGAKHNPTPQKGWIIVRFYVFGGLTGGEVVPLGEYSFREGDLSYIGAGDDFTYAVDPDGSGGMGVNVILVKKKDKRVRRKK